MSGLAAVAVTGALGAACSGPPAAKNPEALPRVEIRYAQAVLKALDKVPGSHLLSVGLGGLSGPRPVWRTRVAADDGTVRLVRVGAIHGELLGVGPPTGQSAADKARVASLVKEVKVLPEDAVDKVKQPDFGQVTDVRLEKGTGGKTVWSITIATVRHGLTHNYQVDAVTSQVVSERTVGTIPPSAPNTAAPGTAGAPSPNRST
ncbi:hypothetical protein [Streptomyces sp. NTH33]|uniref:hypothetical protein n=1 Tax=Streptomyces sp. NTH33 TaxID=1735453 RepID=UPI0011B94883|nr:hypothetical protein [Streptomyces sp. NTH33]